MEGHVLGEHQELDASARVGSYGRRDGDDVAARRCLGWHALEGVSGRGDGQLGQTHRVGKQAVLAGCGCGFLRGERRGMATESPREKDNDGREHPGYQVILPTSFPGVERLARSWLRSIRQAGGFGNIRLEV